MREIRPDMMRSSVPIRLANLTSTRLLIRTFPLLTRMIPRRREACGQQHQTRFQRQRHLHLHHLRNSHWGRRIREQRFLSQIK
jgi:hypothetical protein